MPTTIRPFQHQDLDTFVFRDEEEQEARQGGFTGCAEVVRDAADGGLVYTAVGNEGLPYLFFARNLKDEDPDTAFVWMLGHKDLMYRNRMGMLRGIPTVLNKWHETTPLLYTYMNPKSVNHVRILRAFGFVAIGAVGYGGDPNNPYFEMVRLPHGH